jgi:small subunit ribosomal protein S1
LKEGETVTLRVIKIDPDNHRIGLSVRKVESMAYAEQDWEALENMVGGKPVAASEVKAEEKKEMAIQKIEPPTPVENAEPEKPAEKSELENPTPEEPNPEAPKPE